jgi:hypothetical protein
MLGIGTVRRDFRVLGSIDPSLGSQDSRTSISRPFQIDGLPSEGAQLAVSQARVQRGRPDGAVLGWKRCEQLSRDLGSDDLNLGWIRHWQFEVPSRVDRHPLARPRPPVDRLERLDRVADRGRRVPFGLPVVNQRLQISGGDRGQLPCPKLRQDAFGQRQAIPAQGRGLEQTAGTVANLALLGPLKPGRGHVAERPTVRRAQLPDVERALRVRSPRLRF